MSNKFAGIILAAGEGTRMKSAIPKVLHEICGKPMLGYVLDLTKKLKLKSTLVVVGHKKELFNNLLDEYGVKLVYQDKLLGTADAIKMAYATLKSFKGNCLVLYADQPLLKEEVLKDLLKKHLDSDAHATILTVQADDPFGYGRIVRDNFSKIRKIVEEKDASFEERAIKEINTGVVCFKKDPLFEAIKKIRPNNAKREYYLTDVIEVMSKENLLIESVSIPDDIAQAQGINTRRDLAQAQKIMRWRILEKFMADGVSILDPDSTHIDCSCKIGQDTIIYPFTVIEKGVIIKKSCIIGPFCHLRPGTIIEDKVVVGNFTEIARSRIGKETLMKHFSYLGDAIVGKAVNIGCGTVTANFDGQNKNKTIIGDGAFIGSDTVLRAPLKIGKYAITGAGAVILKNVKGAEVVAGVPARPLRPQEKK